MTREINNILEKGEKLHIIERRYFQNDPRRHFVGEVLEVAGRILRIKGYTWVFDGGRGEFLMRPNIRERIIVLGERLVVNILPKEIEIKNVKYIHFPDKGLCLTDSNDYFLEISEFSYIH